MAQSFGFDDFSSGFTKNPMGQTPLGQMASALGGGGFGPYQSPWEGDRLYDSPPGENMSQRAERLGRGRPPIGTAERDIYQFESAWEPRYAHMSSGSGAAALQSFDRHGWGNYQWEAPERTAQDYLDEIDAQLRDPSLSPEQRMELQQRQRNYQILVVQERQRNASGGRVEREGRYADPRYLQTQYRPMYSGWYMPKDYSRPVGGS